jgi:hypothetical protein
MDTLVNAAGCDSIVTLNLTINKVTTATDTQTACDSFKWIDGVTYTASNTTAMDTLVNAAGCDSIVTLNLTLNNSTTATDTHAACDSFEWIDGVTYTASDTIAKHTLVNAAGCDSVVTLNLTINKSSTTADVHSACDSYTWINGVTYTVSDSSATFILSTSNGCDSIISLKLRINTIDESITSTSDTLTVSESGAQYQWLDCSTILGDNNYTLVIGETGQSFIPFANGSYAVEINKNGCTDTSECTLVNTLGITQNVFGGLIKIYPNPTTGLVNIDAENYKGVEVYDTSGRLIIKSELRTIDLEEQSKGLYILKINANGTIKEFKVFKE